MATKKNFREGFHHPPCTTVGVWLCGYMDVRGFNLQQTTKRLSCALICYILQPLNGLNQQNQGLQLVIISIYSQRSCECLPTIHCCSKQSIKIFVKSIFGSDSRSSQLLAVKNMLSEVYYIRTKVYLQKSSVVSFHTHISSG